MGMGIFLDDYVTQRLLRDVASKNLPFIKQGIK